jgi:hypothetical protein
MSLLYCLEKWFGTGMTFHLVFLWSSRKLHNENMRTALKDIFGVLGATNEGVEIALQCLDVMLTKRRKQVSQQRALAFIKRLCTLALQVLPNSSIGILATTRILMHVSSNTNKEI